jgi:hypothetical protein
VVSGGGGNNAPFSFFRAQLGDQIDPSPDLESPHGLVIFMFDIDFGPHQLVDGRINVERSSGEVRTDPALGEQNILELRDLHGRPSLGKNNSIVSWIVEAS